MNASVLEALQRLSKARIEIVPVPGLTRYFVLARDGFASLVERSGEGFGKVGAAGRVDERGFAALLWRSGEPYFVAKHGEEAATKEDVERLRKFSVDLKAALEPDSHLR
jgi:hypothetical protein